MKRAVLLSVVLFASCLFSSAQDQPRWEFFGGYQYARLDTHDVQKSLDLLTSSAGLPPLDLGNHLNLNWWNVSLQENPLNWIGLIFDVGGSYNKRDVNLAPVLVLPPGTTEVIRLKPSFYTYAGGPQFTYRKNPRFQHLAEFYLGWRTNAPSGNLLFDGLPTLTSDITQKQTCFDFTAGGGIDYHFQKHWAARASADYIRTYFQSLNQNNVRVSVGLTYRWTQAPVF
jgi:opacity protein-like surface antigen